jgi:hypothetical protein
MRIITSLLLVGHIVGIHGHSGQSNADTYDYVIVGAGVSGLVVANRLTENPDSESRPFITQIGR